ncbi:hypothetical protein B0H66DRAFT_538705 [Apodospora peruviana]|uniref:Uncharacterized protein n=1 Tax=Apodospora peruviana TaxID=516989 RepID=A0AAE0HTP7_9PEZI|nr:hypothetical protein B0H66DRAFT_538705 [Apodospora peruviana]
MSKATPAVNFFSLPLEIREKIYELACEEITVHDWNNNGDYHRYLSRYLSAGRGLLCTSKQMTAEAAPFMWRTVKIYPGFPDVCLNPHRRDYATIKRNARRAEIFFACFCSYHLPDLPDTLHNAMYETTGSLFPEYHWLKRWEEKWAAALYQLHELPGLKQLTVTFGSCLRCHLPPRDKEHEQHAFVDEPPYGRQDVYYNEELLGHSAFCVGLERSFLDWFIPCMHVDKLTLRGDVPPSIMFRLMSPQGDDGFKLKLHYMSSGLARFIEARGRLPLPLDQEEDVYDNISGGVLATLWPDGEEAAPADNEIIDTKQSLPYYPRNGGEVIMVAEGYVENLRSLTSFWEKTVREEEEGLPEEGDYPFMTKILEELGNFDHEKTLDYVHEP